MIIYLDIDDTLGDFRSHAIHLGVPTWTGSWYTTDPELWTQEQKDIQKATTAVMSREDFWLTMPTVDHAHELIATAATHAETYLLTAMPSFALAAKDLDMQKMIRKAKMKYATETLHFPARKVIICKRKDKANYATIHAFGDNGRNILVDDAEQNSIEWSDAGGISILHTSALESIRQLKGHLANGHWPELRRK